MTDSNKRAQLICYLRVLKYVDDIKSQPGHYAYWLKTVKYLMTVEVSITCAGEHFTRSCLKLKTKKAQWVNCKRIYHAKAIISFIWTHLNTEILQGVRYRVSIFYLQNCFSSMLIQHGKFICVITEVLKLIYHYELFQCIWKKTVHSTDNLTSL